MDLEELSSLNLAFKILYDDPNCHVTSPSFTTKDKIPYHGLVGSHQAPFMFGNSFYIFELVPGRPEPYMSLCDLSTLDSDPSQGYMAIKHKRVYMEYRVKSYDILKVNIVDKLVVFATSTELLFFKFKSGDTPEFVYSMALEDNSIRDFDFRDTSILYLASSSTLKLYNISNITSMDTEEPIEFTEYVKEGESPTSLKDLRALTMCDNVIFLADDSHILIFKNASKLTQSSALPVIRVIEMSSTVLEIKKIGRSLIILTKDGLTEYIFINDCLDLTLNLYVRNEDLGFYDKIPSVNSKFYVELQGDPDASHFLLLNKIADTIYIFQSGTIQGTLPTQYVHTYSDNANNIFHADIHEKYDETGHFELLLHIRQKDDQLNLVKLRKEPAQMTCSSWMPKTEACYVNLQSRFCDTRMYNYTLLEDNGESQYYNDPNLLCDKVLLIILNFEWSIALIGICAGAGAILLTLICLTLWLCVKKIKAKRKNSTQQKHVKFNNEEKQEGDSESKPEVFTFSNTRNTNSNTTDMHVNRDNSNNLARRDRKQLWKNYSEHKNLSIMVPRQFDGEKYTVNNELYKDNNA